MTCREKLAIEHPECITDCEPGGCMGCPSDYGYMGNPIECGESEDLNPKLCTKCWDREISGETTREPSTIKDSGDRTEFATGAVRDMREGKGRCDLMPLDVIAEIYALYDDSDFDREANEILSSIYDFQQTCNIDKLRQVLFLFSRYHTWSDMFLEVAKHFEDGAKKYGENNWQKGIPVKCYIDSAVRHYLKYLRGDTDEPHDRAFVWNILCCIWTCKHMPHLNDYADSEASYNNKTEETESETFIRCEGNECVACGMTIPEGEMYCHRCKQGKEVDPNG